MMEYSMPTGTAIPLNASSEISTLTYLVSSMPDSL